MDQKNVRSSSERRPWDSTVIPCQLSDERLKAVRHLTSVIEKAHYCTVEEEVGFYFTSGLPKRRWNVDMDLYRRDEDFPESFDLSTLQLIAFLAGIAVAKENHRTEHYPDNLFAGAQVGWDESDFGVAFIGDIRKRDT